jgi:glycosyltransferase involved in cell wall biosynthesis
MKPPDSQPLVSMTIFCYNHESYVEECLESVRAQTYKHTELIIMDDASTDNSVAVIRNWIMRHGIRCQFIVHERNVGVSRTINEAYALARGDYLAPCSGDDVWLVDKIEKQVPIMESLPEDYGLLYSDAFQIDESSQPLARMFIETQRKFDAIPQGNVRAELLDNNFIPGMTMLVRKKAQEDVGPYDPSLAYEDWDMMIRFAQRYKFAYSPEASVKYRVCASSFSKRLLSTQRLAVLLTNFSIYRRSLSYDWLNKDQHARLVANLVTIAKTLFRTREPECKRALRETLRQKFSFRLLGMYLLCVCHIPAGVSSSLLRPLRSASSGQRGL